VGLQFKRRFWEEDEQIYGGITYTDLPIANIGYPNSGYFSAGKGVLLGAYIFGLDALEFTGMTPQQRVQKAVEYGSLIHPQYRQEFENGVAVAWLARPSRSVASAYGARRRARSITMICAALTGASHWRASTPRTSGLQEVRSPRRWMPSINCIGAQLHKEIEHDRCIRAAP